MLVLASHFLHANNNGNAKEKLEETLFLAIKYYLQKNANVLSFDIRTIGYQRSSVLAIIKYIIEIYFQ